MSKPPNPWVFYKKRYSGNKHRLAIQVKGMTLSQLIAENPKVDRDYAHRLALQTGTSAGFWLTLQENYDRWYEERERSKITQTI